MEFELFSGQPNAKDLFLSGIRDLRSGLQADIHQRYERYLSFPDLLVDRWTRAREYGFGTGSSCYDSVLILGDVTVGEHTWIGPNVVLDGSGGLTIGSYCSISASAQVYTHNSVEWSTSLGKESIRRAETCIGDGVYIGPSAIVEMGVTIGDRAVIGALSLVKSDVPPGARCFGVPGRVLE